MKKEKPSQPYLLLISLVFIFWATVSLSLTLTPWRDFQFSQLMILLILPGILIFFTSTGTSGEKVFSFIETSRIASRVGLMMYGCAIAVEILFFSSWFRIIIDNPDTTLRLKHVMISIPLSVGLAILLFQPIYNPLSNPKEQVITRSIVRLALAAISFGFIVFALDGFGDLKLLSVMTATGAIIGLGQLISGKLYLTLTTLTLVIYTNSLSSDRFEHVPWIIAVGFFLLSGAILFFAWTRRDGLNRIETTYH